MLVFAAITPHAPILIPSIGLDNSIHCHETIEAMKELSSEIEKKDVDTLIIISPHTSLSSVEMTVSNGGEACGNMSNFGHPEMSYKMEIDHLVAHQIHHSANAADIETRLLDHEGNFEIDHGAFVPLFFLRENISTTTKIVILGYSEQSRSKHFAFGQTIAEVAKKSDKNIAIIASGDYSHHLFDVGSEFIGRKFDAEIVEALKNFNPAKLLKIDEYLQEEAGECGYRSLLILLGALDGLEPGVDVLSYEGPFGVGYLVVNFNI